MIARMDRNARTQDQDLDGDAMMERRGAISC
jgi:hypothetical protein